jgi:hypothetical protein
VDLEFWDRFEGEFGAASRKRNWNWILAPAALGGALVLALFLVTLERSPIMDAPELSEQELLEHYELLADFQDIELTVENFDFLAEGS